MKVNPVSWWLDVAYIYSQKAYNFEKHIMQNAMY